MKYLFLITISVQFLLGTQLESELTIIKESYDSFDRLTLIDNNGYKSYAEVGWFSYSFYGDPSWRCLGRSMIELEQEFKTYPRLYSFFNRMYLRQVKSSK